MHKKFNKSCVYILDLTLFVLDNTIIYTLCTVLSFALVLLLDFFLSIFQKIEYKVALITNSLEKKDSTNNS